jgi:Flp pilus assembly protein TadD
LGGFVEIVVTETLVSIRWKREGTLADRVEEAVGCLSSGDYNRGVAMLRFARKTGGDNLTILFNLGMALSDMGELEEAIACLEAATRIPPGQSRVYTALGVAYARHKKPTEARRALEEAVRLDPEDSYALRNLGSVLLGLRGDEARARSLLKKATELAPKDQQAWLGLGNAEEALGHTADADEAYLKALEINPHGPVAEKVQEGRGRIAETTFRAKAGVRMDAVMYCSGALKTFVAMKSKEIEKVAMEIAILGTRGLDVNDSAQKYQLRSLPGEYSGLHLLCIEYVGFKLTKPELDIGFDLSTEYTMAKDLFPPGSSKS